MKPHPYAAMVRRVILNSNEGWNGQSHSPTPATREPSTMRSTAASITAPRGEDRKWSREVSPSTPSRTFVAWIRIPESRPCPHARPHAATMPSRPATTVIAPGGTRNGARDMVTRVEIGRFR
jgi:hypothetical protein